MGHIYHLADEPLPTPLAKFAAHPIFPLLALMFGGAWLAWPWFALNAVAMGSPTRGKEARWLGAALLGSVVIALVVVWAAQQELMSAYGVRLSVLGLQVWKLAFAYRLQMLQDRTYELFVYYGAEPVSTRPALAVLVLAGLVRSSLLDQVGSLFLVLVLA